MRNFIVIAGLIAGLIGVPPSASAHEPVSNDVWTSGWGTAQELTPPTQLNLPRPPASVMRSMGARRSPVTIPYPEKMGDETVRMIVQTTIGGRAVRVQLSNAVGRPSLLVGAAHVALRSGESRIAPGSDRALTFSGKPTVTIPPGAVVISDPVALNVAAGQELAVSVYVPKEINGLTVHPVGLNPTYLVKGDATAAPAFENPRVLNSYFWLMGLEVLADQPRGTIVAFGDSITDGFLSTQGAHRTYPELLARRLQADPRTRGWGVVNVGISGNRIRRDGAGASALARFDRDVLSRPNVKWIIMLEGVNDINITVMPGAPEEERTTAADIIDAYTQFIERAHLHGIKVMGATITPTEGLWLHTPQSEQMRQTINQWIRTSGKFDAVADFDAATRDPNRPARLRAEFDPGDHIHPNDAGYEAMTAAIDLRHFRR